MFQFRLLTISTALFAAFHCGVNAQPYYFRHFQVENGLSNSTVFSALQAKNGFLWFGTKEGLNRFDGYHFKQFPLTGNTNALGSDMVYCLFSDPGGVLWAGGQNGLFRLDCEHEQFVRVLDSLREINWIQTDDKGNLWFLAMSNLYRYNFATQRVRKFPEPEYFHGTCVAKSEDGGIWCTDNLGRLWRWNEATDDFTAFDLFAHSPPPSSRMTQRVRAAGKDRLLIGTDAQGLKSFDIKTGQYKDILTYSSGRSTLYVRDFLQYSPEEFWIATEAGIYIMNTGTGKVVNLKKKFLDPYSLSDNAIYSLCKDSEGGVWAGTYFGGVNHYSKQHAFFEKYYPDNSAGSISGSSVREICQDFYNNIWIGTEDAGLNKLDEKTGTITHFLPTGSPKDISYTNIHGLMPWGDRLWIGTFEHGLDVMDIKTGKVIRHYMYGAGPHQLKSNFVLTLITTSTGRIALGTSNGAYWYNPETDDFTPLPGVPFTFISIIAEDHDGVLWVGTHGLGVYLLDPRTGATGHFAGNEGEGKGLSSSMINALVEDNAYNIWFSTEGGGLCKLGADRKSFSAFTTANGLPSNFVFKLVQDDNHDYWVTTSKGLVKIRQSNNAISIYTRGNGLLNDQFNYNSGFKDKNGKLYFGSVRGMITCRPDDFVSPNFEPAIYITGVQVDNAEVKAGAYTDKITLSYDQSSISIDFAALSYASPDRTKYSYFMEGLDRTWTDLATNRKVYFTNLAPGHYRFKLKAAVGGRWSRATKELAVVILPPIWETGWAYGLYSLLLILLIRYIVLSYHRRTEIKKEKDIYEAKIEFFTNVAHEIRTPLTLIKGPADNLIERIDELPEIKEDVLTMDRNTNRLITLVNQILDFRQTEMRGFSIDFTRVNITALMHDSWLSFQSMVRKKHLQVSWDLPAEDVYAMADEEALKKIFSNLFSNAVKYGEREIWVRIIPPGIDKGDIAIEIANDGAIIPPEMGERIFEPFYRLKGSNRQKGTGIGLALARSLVLLHKGRLSLADDHSGKNKFILVLPARPKADKKGSRVTKTYSN